MFIIFSFLKIAHKWLFLDAECAIDSKLNPIPLDSPKVKNPEIHSVAFILTGFHDMCRCCHNEPNGIITLNTRLACSLGYKVLSVSYTELGTQDSLVNTVQYLKDSLKNMLSEP